MTAVHPLRLRAFIAQVDTTGGLDACWIWHGHRNEDNYGVFGKGGNPAHRVAYELMVRPIPEGMCIDHLCHNVDSSCTGGTTCQHRPCVNPAHLEAVTQGENVLRSPHTMPHHNAAKTHCPQGHEYTPENTYSRRTAAGRARRECKTCRRERLGSRARAVALITVGGLLIAAGLTTPPAPEPTRVRPATEVEQQQWDRQALADALDQAHHQQ